jgi:hypothetical protein
MTSIAVATIGESILTVLNTFMIGATFVIAAHFAAKYW